MLTGGTGACTGSFIFGVAPVYAHTLPDDEAEAAEVWAESMREVRQAAEDKKKKRASSAESVGCFRFGESS